MNSKTVLVSAAVLVFVASASSARPHRAHTQAVVVSESTDATFEQDVLNCSQPVLVDFYATWCGPCKFMTPVVDRLAKKYKNNLKVVRVDIDKNPSVAEQMRITSIPLFVIYKNGKPVEKAVGAMPKERLAEMVQRNVM